MPKRSRKPQKEDANEIAARITASLDKGPEKPAKNPAAVALGRLGGLKGGKARADKLSKAQRTKIAKKAAKARWERGL